MFTRRQANAGLVSAAVLAGSGGLAAAAPKSMTLPPPRNERRHAADAGAQARRSTRAYADRALPPQVLSDLLWAAFGVNRPPATAPRPIGGTSW